MSFLNALSLMQFNLSKTLSRILAPGISFYFCFHVYIRHRGSVLCISLHGNNVASGSRDKSVKVWNFTTAKCRRTFRHRHVVHTVQVSDTIVVSGCEGGKVKVWDIEQASLLKSLDGHHGAITSVKFDEYHILTSSLDCYAMAWSAIGNYKKCLQAFRHPKEVLCLEVLFCRVITGSADGKVCAALVFYQRDAVVLDNTYFNMILFLLVCSYVSGTC